MADERYILINGEKVPVTEEVYRAYKRPAWREHKRKERERENGTTPLSLEVFAAGGYDIPSGDALVDEIVADKLLLDMLMSALDKLTAEERSLIDALYYADKSEREFARDIGVPRKTLAYRKNKILDKLKKIIENL